MDAWKHTHTRPQTTPQSSDAAVQSRSPDLVSGVKRSGQNQPRQRGRRWSKIRNVRDVVDTPSKPTKGSPASDPKDGHGFQVCCVHRLGKRRAEIMLCYLGVSVELKNRRHCRPSCWFPTREVEYVQTEHAGGDDKEPNGTSFQLIYLKIY